MNDTHSQELRVNEIYKICPQKPILHFRARWRTVADWIS